MDKEDSVSSGESGSSSEEEGGNAGDSSSFASQFEEGLDIDSGAFFSVFVWSVCFRLFGLNSTS